MKNVIEEAVKNGLRFKTSKGNLTTEGLYDLTHTDAGRKVLKETYVAYRKHNADNVDDLDDLEGGTRKTKEQARLELSIEVLAYVRRYGIAERDRIASQRETRLRRERRNSVIAEASESTENSIINDMSPGQLQVFTSMSLARQDEVLAMSKAERNKALKG